MPLFSGFPDNDITRLADMTFRNCGYCDMYKPPEYLTYIITYINIYKQIIWEFTRDKILDSLDPKFCYTNIYDELITAYDIVTAGKIPSIIKNEYYTKTSNIDDKEWLYRMFPSDKSLKEMFIQRWETALLCKIGYERNVKDIIYTEINLEKPKTSKEIAEENEMWQNKILDGKKQINFEENQVPALLRDEFEIYERSFWEMPQ